MPFTTSICTQTAAIRPFLTNISRLSGCRKVVIICGWRWTSPPDLNAAREGILQNGNSPDDVASINGSIATFAISVTWTPLSKMDGG